MNKKAVFIDIDGTIISTRDNMISPSIKTQYAFKELIKNNYVFLASGRSKATFPKGVCDLETNGYIGSNGQYACVNGKDIYYKTIDKDLVLDIYKYIESIKGSMLITNKDNVYKVTFNNKQYEEFIRFYSLECEYKKFDIDSVEAAILNPVVYTKAQEEYLMSTYGDRLDIRKQPDYMSYDVGLIGESKGNAVKRILEYLDIPKEDAYCFGDEVNDIEMMQAVGNSICMANGNKKVKEAASCVCESVLEDGVYYELVRRGLINKIV